MFLQKVKKATLERSDTDNDKCHGAMKKKWKTLTDAILFDKIDEYNLDEPIDSSIMDKAPLYKLANVEYVDNQSGITEVVKQAADGDHHKRKKNNDMKTTRLFELQ